MGQETAPLTTQNSASTGGFFGSLFSGLTNLVTAAAPVAADVYQLRAQGELLKNQSAQQLEQVKLEQQRLAAQAQQQPQATQMKLPAWLPYAAGLALVLALILVLIRRR
ncbi:MAG: hypothetical protein PHE83_09405 [Opitutaceae bacterium]|nr:hypothetical protein [Opitutaceae bacterium]